MRPCLSTTVAWRTTRFTFTLILYWSPFFWDSGAVVLGGAGFCAVRPAQNSPAARMLRETCLKVGKGEGDLLLGRGIVSSPGINLQRRKPARRIKLNLDPAPMPVPHEI